MPRTIRVVIPVKRDAGPSNNNLKGRLFERLIGAFLATQSYEVKERLRDVGTEIDLLCRSAINNQTVIVECKAHERSLGSEVVSKIYSDAKIHEARCGWIFAISELGSEAAGRLEKLNDADQEIRLTFFSSHELADLLIKAEKLARPPDPRETQRTSSQVTLALFEHQRLWITAALDERGERPIGLLAWNAETGVEVAPEEAPDLSDTDYPYAELPWLPHSSSAAKTSSVAQPIVEVIPGDEWSDYRPSRPNDFVGRVALIEDISDFFDAIRAKKTQSRIFGVKGRSGWGKSSLAIKLAHDLPGKNVFILPVDCRAASSSFYADMALAKALQKAATGHFNMPLFAPNFDFQVNPFETPSVTSFLQDVEAVNGLIVIIFDQFEAIIHRSELRVVFDRLRQLALYIDEFRGPIAIGFSWKTDGTVSSDNPGYHLWHSLSDRRRDFEVDRFSRDDADQFMSLALKSARTQLPRSVCQFILEHYAGFPWLLKKLIKHCVDDAKRNDDSFNVRSYFNIASLFDNDLQELSNSDTSALRFIAREAPVELHVAEEKCGAETISSLMDRRLLIKSGSQLSLYWDIFRDYVLNGQVPQLPNTYVPTISVRKLRSIVRHIVSNRTSTYTELASALGISPATADNTVRDLINMGLVDANRSAGEFASNCTTPEEATLRIVNFLKSHAIYVRTKSLVEAGSSPTLSMIEALTIEDYAFLSIDPKTLKTYVRKLIVYCLEFSLLGRKANEFYLSNPHVNIVDAPRRTVVFSEDDLFRGAAPPERVIELLDALAEEACTTLAEASKRKLRNAVYAASRLGLVEHRDGRVRPIVPLDLSSDREDLVASHASRVEPIKSALETVNVRDMSSNELGTYLSDLFELNWSASSCHRYGFALRDWCIWLEDFYGRRTQPH